MIYIDLDDIDKNDYTINIKIDMNHLLKYLSTLGGLLMGTLYDLGSSYER